MYPKPWICSSGHVLGVVVRVQGIRHLNLYRQAVLPGEGGEIIANITGPAFGATCSICGCKRNWFIGDEAIRELLEARGISHENQK